MAPLYPALEKLRVTAVIIIDALYQFFALDSQPVFVHHGITSQPALQLVPVKLMFAGSLAAACKSSDPVDLHKNLSPRRPAIRGQCALQTRSSPQAASKACDESKTGDFMTSIRNFAFTALLAFTALNFTPSTASAQEPAHGKFTLTHEVHWGNAKVPAGDYAFSFDPDGTSRTLTLNKLSGERHGYLIMVPAADNAKPSDLSLLILESTPSGSYVSAMQLPQFGMTLRFTVPTRTEKEIAKAATVAAALGQ
jgi:hypothetical protein